MKNLMIVLMVAAVLLTFCCSIAFAESIVPETEQPQASSTETAQPVGVTIPRSIVIAIVVGAVVIGSVSGYWYARRRK